MFPRGPMTRRYGRCATAMAAVAAALLSVVSSFAAGEAPPAPTRWVTDGAGFLSEPARQAMDARLRDYETATGRQFLVWIGRTTGEVPIEDFAVRAFKAWGVGQRGKDDGLVLFIFGDDRTARFEVGYGLEGAFPDVAASRVIREVLAPRLQTGDRDGAVLAAIEAATSTILSEEGGRDAVGVSPEAPSRGRGQPRPLRAAEKIVIGLVVVGFLFILITNPALALYLLQVIASSGGSRGGGWGGGGGGGWSGGGGRSGGGGASGSW